MAPTLTDPVAPANPYDAVVAQQDAAPIAAPAAAPNPWDAVVAKQDAGAQQPLRTAVVQAAQTTPDRAAQVQALSDRTGLAPALVDRNFETIQKRAQYADTPYAQMLKDSPATATFLAHPPHAAVAADDHGPLGALEYLFTLPTHALQQSYYENQAGALSAQRFFGDLSPADQQRLADARSYADEYSRLMSGDSWYRRVLTPSMKFLAGLVQPAAAPATIGAVVGGVAGAFAGPEGILPGAAFGASVGATMGLATSAFLTSAGTALERNLKVTDAFGQRLDAPIAKVAALGEGVLNAALMVGGGKIVGPVVEAAAGKLGALFTRDAVAKALQQPSVIAALGDLATRTALGTTELSLFGAGQQAATILSDAIVSAGGGAGPATPPVPTATEAAGAIGAAAVETAKAGVLTMAAFPAIGMLADLRRAKLAQFTPAFVDALGEGATQSKTAQRAPQAFQDFITAASKDGPIPTLYVPLDAWNAHWQGKGVDPATMAATVTGDPQAYDLATRQGGDLGIPTGRYASLLASTDANAAFRNELRLSPDAMNGREAADLMRQAQTMPLPTAEAPSAAETAAVAQLVNAGQPQDVAEAGGRLFTAITSLADRAGLNPQEIFDPAKLAITGEPGAEIPPLPAEAVPPAAIAPPAKAGLDPAVLARLVDAQPVAAAETPAVSSAAAQDQPLAAMSDLNAAVAQMRAENAQLRAEADAMQPKLNATVAPVEMIQHLSADIDEGLGDESQGDTSFNVDTLTTGEQQPRLPGDVGAVRTQEQPTPAVGEAPFSLSSERPSPLGQAIIKTLFQTGDEGARGSYTPGASGAHVIRLLEHADLSTAVHEFGHLFHNVFADVVARLDTLDPATLTESQKKVLADYATLRTWLGAEPRGELTTAQHEQLANGFVAYLREGKAPSVALQSTFARFRAWLTRVYASASQLGLALTPDVRGVFDRLLVSDQAIRDAEEQRGVSPLFTTPDAAGMSPAEFEQYRQTVQTAHDTAQRELDQRLMRDVAREQSKTYRDQREAIHATVTAELQDHPVYRAIAAISNGEHPDGSSLGGPDQPPDPLKLSRAIVEGRYGADVRKSLPRGLTIADGGLDPDAAAELFGFSSGDALIKAIVAAPKLSDAIASETTARMIQQHGGMLFDGTLQDAAQAAVANADHDAVVKAEMRALGKLQRFVAPFLTQQARDAKAASRAGVDAIRGSIPPEEVLKANARGRLAGMAVGTIRPDVFWTAARRAALQATERAGRQDFAGAITSKQQELINLHLYREASAAKDDVQQRLDRTARLDRPGARATLGKVGGGFLDQIDGVLDRFGFSTADRAVLERKASIESWQRAKQADGVPVDLSSLVLTGDFRAPYKDLTLAQFRTVTDDLTQLDHLARAEGRTFKSNAADAFQTERDGLVASIREKNVTRTQPLEFGRAENRKLSFGNYLASMTKLSVLARGLDGSEDGGPMWEAFIRRANEAADAENAMNVETGTRLNAVLDAHYPGLERRTLAQRTEVPGVGSLSKEARLAVALNSGTVTGRDRLLSDPSRKWTAAQHQAILDTLDQRDWQFVQDTWTEINRFRDPIGAKQRRVTGVEPQWVEGIPIQTRFGEIPGAYYPLKYDGRLASRAVQLDLMNAAKLQMGAAYVATTTERGFIETRQAHVGLPVRLDLGVGYQHLGQVIHDLTHHEMLIDVTRLLRDRQVSEAIYQTKGSHVYRQFTDAFQDIATGLAGPTDVLQRSANFLRSGLQIANMGVSLSIAVKHPMGIFNGAALLGPEWMAKGVARWAGDATHLDNTLDWITSNSPMMRDRVHTGNADLADLSVGLKQAGGWFDTAVRAITADHLTQQTIRDGLVWHIGFAQRAADVPTWLGGYEKAMDAQRRAGGAIDETRAFRLADQAVLDSQGGGNLIDRAAVQRGNAYARLFMTFYSYGARVFNSTVEATQRTNFRSPASVIKYLGNLTLLYVMPALANEAIRQASGTVKHGEDATASFLTNVGKDMLATALNGLVGVREIGYELANFAVDEPVRDYTGPAGLQYFTNVTRALQQTQRALTQGEVDEPLARALDDVFGPLVPYPSSQIDKTVAGWEALRDGRTTNPGVLAFGPPPAPK